MRSLRWFGALAVVGAFAATACGDSSGPGVGPVALLTDGAYVDYNPVSAGAEASQVEYTIKSFGLTVLPIATIDSTAWATAFASSRVLVIPEETTDIASALSAGA